MLNTALLGDPWGPRAKRKGRVVRRKLVTVAALVVAIVLGAASELASAGGALVEPVNQSWTNVFRDSPFPQDAARCGDDLLESGWIRGVIVTQPDGSSTFNGESQVTYTGSQTGIEVTIRSSSRETTFRGDPALVGAWWVVTSPGIGSVIVAGPVVFTGVGDPIFFGRVEAFRPGEPNEPVLQAIFRAYDAIGC
jgi:hypothetical protein